MIRKRVVIVFRVEEEAWLGWIWGYSTRLNNKIGRVGLR